MSLQAENAKLRSDLAEAKAEEQHSLRLIGRQAKLLTATVNALRGEPPDDTLWSHHDVAELARAVIAERDKVRAALERATTALEGCRYSEQPLARELRQLLASLS